MAFKFIHIADVHLDTPFENKDINIRKMLRDKVRGSFEGAVDAAIANSVDAFLIAGDLFDNDTLSFATEKFITEQMERLRTNKIKVFYAPGNHDPSGIKFKTSRIKWPDNVYIFRNSKAEIVKLYNSDGSIKAVIAGAGHEGSQEGRNLAADFPYADKNVPYIGLLHTYVSGRSGDSSAEKYAPCSLVDLTNKNYLYWALGHIHIKDVISEFPHIIYPGCVCGRNPKETGIKGAMLVEIDREVKYTFIALSNVIWETIDINNISDAVDFSKLIYLIQEKIYEKIKEDSISRKYMIRVILSGPTALFRELHKEENISVLEEELKNSMNIEYIDIKADDVVKPVNPSEYRGEPHVLGTALTLIDLIKTQDELLLKIKPERFAGIPANADINQISEYMMELLEGIDYDLCARLLGGDEK